MIYFLFGRGNKTGDVLRLIKRLNGKSLQKRGYDFYMDGVRKKLEFFDNDVAIRWGAKWVVPITTINSIQGVVNAAHKRIAREILQGVVPVPETWFRIEDAQVPFIARPAMHTHGRSFIMVKTIGEKRALLGRGLRGWYFSEFLDTKEEYRLYVGHGEVLGAYKKAFKEGEVRSNRAVTNLSWGSMVDYTPELAKVAIDACYHLKLDTGAVDIMVKDTPFVIEVNTTPAISTQETEDMYFNYFKTWM